VLVGIGACTFLERKLPGTCRFPGGALGIAVGDWIVTG
jgi:hypothetical protein